MEEDILQFILDLSCKVDTLNLIKSYFSYASFLYVESE